MSKLAAITAKIDSIVTSDLFFSRYLKLITGFLDIERATVEGKIERELKIFKI